jgi:carbon-monoxide dehydrogenase small subunit
LKFEPSPALHPVRLQINGSSHQLLLEARTLLSDAIRHHAGLTGTHIGCEHGVCGACTVLVDGRPVRSCLLFAVQTDGSEITTVEGLASPGGELHPAQEGFIQEFGFQCGFCTSGMVIAAYHLLEENSSPSDEEIKEAIGGHLCRCTGYADIIRAIRWGARKLAGGESES